MVARGGLILGSLLIAMPPAQAAPANSLAQLWKTLGGCIRLNDVPTAAAGSEVTVLFSLKRDGSLLGRPRITHSRLLGGAGDQQDFIAGALAAVSRCLPAEITDGLGGAIAGRPLSFRITSQRLGRDL